MRYELWHLPSPVRYRELHVNRALYLGAWVLWVFPWLFQVTSNMRPFSHEILREIILGYINGITSTLRTDMAIAALLGIAIMWNDRGRGQLSFALEGPIRRRDVMKAKIWYSFLTVVAGNLAIVLLLLLASVTVGNMALIDGILVRCAFLILWQWSIVVTALAVSAAVGSVIFIGIALGIMSVLPLLGASLIQMLTWPRISSGPAPGPPTTIVPPHWTLVLSNAVLHLSPVAPDYPMGWIQLVFALAAMLWAVLIGRWGLKWWEHAPLERFYDPFMFLMLWNFYYAFLAIVTTVVVGTLVTSKYSLNIWEFVVFSLVVAVSSWFMWRWLIILIGRTRSRWGAGTKTKW
ncbi:MAG: hypothetical protein C7B46_11655 [Sulfobacillus benefaciens]|uniref:ABC transporter permease n=1 Tax=Sulfobacillus benefaciens TaxID=453960 RepID=A0A2T2XEX8_9FIRM|nr:MAG: hypothetical protein C7B46_11655 [Sulfobacillus benefaciens]